MIFDFSDFNSSSEMVHSRWISRFLSTHHSEIFWNIQELFERYLLQFNDTLLFKNSDFLILWSFWSSQHQMHIQMIE